MAASLSALNYTWDPAVHCGFPEEIGRRSGTHGSFRRMGPLRVPPAGPFGSHQARSGSLLFTPDASNLNTGCHLAPEGPCFLYVENQAITAAWN